MKINFSNPTIYIIICVFSFILYGNTLKNGFSMDDEFVIKNNKLVQQGVTAIPEIFTSPYFTSKEWSFGYRPLTKAFYALECEIYGENLFMHHLINVLLYALCACLIFYVFSTFFVGFVSANFWFLTTLIFIAHPVHTEIVNSLKNREDIICLIFSLLSFRSFFQFIDGKHIIALLSGLLFLILAFLTKQTAVIFCLIIPSAFIIREIMRGKGFFESMRSFRVWFVVFLSLIITYIFFKIPQWFLPAEHVDLLSFENPLHVANNLSTTFFLAFYCIWVYLKLLLFPHPLLYYYGMYVIPAPSLSNIYIWISLIISLGEIIYALMNLKKKPMFTFALSLFFFGLLPFLNIIIPMNGIVAERLLYFPVLGFAIIIVMILYGMNSLNLNANVLKGKRSGMAWVIFAVLILLYSGKSISRNKDWKDSKTLFSADMKYLDESVKANDIYATEMFDEVYKQVTAGKNVKDKEAKLQSIISHYKKSLELFPENPKAQHNLSTIYLSFYRDAPNAIIHAKKALSMDPDNFKMYFNLGQAFQLMNIKDSAEHYYRLTAEMDSSFEQAWQSLILMYAELRNPDSLKTIVEEYQMKYPKNDYGWATLGSVYVSRGDTLLGIECFEKAIAIKPQEKEKIIPIWRYYMQKGNLLKSAYYQKLLEVAK